MYNLVPGPAQNFIHRSSVNILRPAWGLVYCALRWGVVLPIGSALILYLVCRSRYPRPPLFTRGVGPSWLQGRIHRKITQ